MRASGGSSQLWDIDQVRADIATEASLTLDKSTWNEVFFTIIGGAKIDVAKDVSGGVSCTALDANTVTVKNECNTDIAPTGIKALRVT